MASSTLSKRPHFPAMPRRTDEEFINRSLLDSLDAQGDAEPPSSSDSEAAGVTSFGSSSNSSSGSPSVPYHFSAMHAQAPPPPRAESPTHHLQHQHHSDSLFNSQQNTHTHMYNSISNPDYSDLDAQKQGKVNGFGPSGQYRTTTAFNAFSNTRMRNHQQQQHTPASSIQYRDTNNSSYPYPTAADVFPTHMTSPTQPHQQPSSLHNFEQHQGRGFDYGVNGGLPVPQQQQFGPDPYGHKALVNGVVKQNNLPLSAPPPGLQHLDNGGYSSQAPYTNGIHVQSQMPYGPHLHTNGPPSASVNGATPTTNVMINGMSQQTNGTASSQANIQEEISTIFVVGFPEDMQEREFQNMFTFSSGFEAATLKIPNKEYTAYGGPGANLNAPPGTGPGSMPLPRSSLSISYGQYGAAGSNDPYNLVTVNQGGVVVDGGRDGTTASWPSLPPPGSAQDPMDMGNFGLTGQGANAMPPKKQIIGFAKFRSRQEALDARDVLQGRRVDIEKGAVLKAEMAKKNLHTKRGVGLMAVGVGSASGAGPGGMGTLMGGAPNGAAGAGEQYAALNMNGGGEAMTARERELGALGAMGFGGLNQWREHRGSIIDSGMRSEDEDRRRDRDVGVAMGLGGTRGPRERAEDDEREREKRRKEKEMRLRNTNANAFDAFHAVPLSRVGSNSLLSPNGTAESVGGTSPMMSQTFAQQQHSPNLHAQEDYGISNGVLGGPWEGMKMSMTSATFQPANGYRHQAQTDTRPSSPHGFSDSMDNTPHNSMVHQHQPPSPRFELSQHGGLVTTSTSSVPVSSASSNAGESQTGSEVEIVNVLGELDMNSGVPGNASPQLPSPGSSGSGGNKANVIDQNPPINTLYVGNLPTSQMGPGYPANYLEESLRELFQRRSGYRKLCFRQKSNGPMCFVEFEDVTHAGKALNELYGNTLNGLIKGGGIRLSYSKNPLGVRTPTSAGGNGPSLQQQQQHNNALQQGLASPFPPDAFQSRQHDIEGRNGLRRDMSGAASPPYTYSISPPPPRFFSPPPASATFSNSLGDNTPSFSRLQSSYGFPPPHSAISSFSPFGLASPPHSHLNIPDQSNSELEEQQQHSLRALSPTANA